MTFVTLPKQLLVNSSSNGTFRLRYSLLVISVGDPTLPIAFGHIGISNRAISCYSSELVSTLWSASDLLARRHGCKPHPAIDTGHHANLASLVEPELFPVPFRSDLETSLPLDLVARAGRWVIHANRLSTVCVDTQPSNS